MKAKEINLYLMLAMFRYASRCEVKNIILLREKIFLITSIVLTRCLLLRHKVSRRSNLKYFQFSLIHYFVWRYVRNENFKIWCIFRGGGAIKTLEGLTLSFLSCVKFSVFPYTKGYVKGKLEGLCLDMLKYTSVSAMKTNQTYSSTKLSILMS